MRQGRVESAVAVVAVADDPASPTAAATEAPGEGPRHTIYTAAYRYTRKGPDRGAWAVDVVAQADAPLDALPAVMRGVQRRSDGLCADLQVATGDAWPDADRLSGADFRALIADGPIGARAAVSSSAATAGRGEASTEGTGATVEGGAA
jgi:hypothetical protein